MRRIAIYPFLFRSVVGRGLGGRFSLGDHSISSITLVQRSGHVALFLLGQRSAENVRAENVAVGVLDTVSHLLFLTLVGTGAR